MLGGGGGGGGGRHVRREIQVLDGKRDDGGVLLQKEAILRETLHMQQHILHKNVSKRIRDQRERERERESEREREREITLGRLRM